MLTGKQHIDRPLDQGGPLQAVSLCQQMFASIAGGELNVTDAIAMSPLRRCEQTIKPLIRYLEQYCNDTNKKMPIIFKAQQLREKISPGRSGGLGPTHIDTTRANTYPTLGASGYEHLLEPCINIFEETKEQAEQRGLAQLESEARWGAILAKTLGKDSEFPLMKHITCVLGN